MKILFRLVSSALFVFVLDWVTKAWAEQTLVPHQPEPVIGDFFRLTLGYNTGVAFGMFTNSGIWPLVVTGVIIVGLIVWFTQALYQEQFPARAAWAVGMLLGGAIGNFVDRLLHGKVTDFLDFGIGTLRWPTFNIADSFILIGVGLLVIFTFNYTPPAKEASQFDDVAPTDSNPDSLLS